MQEIPPQQPAPPAPPSTPATNGSPIFFGPNGLRAGWSILVYIAVLFLLGTLARFELHWVMKHVVPHPNAHELHPSLAIAGEAVFLLVVVLATAVMAWFERRRVAAYGLLGTDRLRQFIIGLFTGFGFLSLLVGILTLTHHLTITPAHQPVRMSLAYAAAWGLCFFLVGMTEEFALRGYLLYTLARGIRFWPAAVVLAILFGLMHKGNPGESPFGLIAAALIALVFSLSLWRLGHLWWAIGFHMAWDWAESYFYGTADSGLVSSGRLLHAQPSGNILLSGGLTGPEGSAWVLLIIALVALFIWKTQPYRGVRLHSGNPN
jgi:membrane protease YdiL (CAAX protease family)